MGTCTGNFWHAEYGDWTGPAGPQGTRTGGLVDWLVFEDLPHPCGGPYLAGSKQPQAGSRLD